MSDDPARQVETAPVAAAAPAPAPLPVGEDEVQPLASPYIQITEVEAGPLVAADALERRDIYGRVPVMVRVRRQPPINPVLILIAIGLGASGLLLPLFLALRAVIILAAVVMVLVGLISRLFIRVPAGSVALVMKAGRYERTLTEGSHTVNPMLAMTHVVTTREFVFDVPVHDTRAADGVNVSVDILVTLQITDPLKFVYSITTGDADQLVRAAAQDAVRRMIRSMESMTALDLGPEHATILRDATDASVLAYGISVRQVAFTHVALPAAITASLEATRLASIQLQELAETFILAQRQLADKAALVNQEAEARLLAVKHQAAAESLRLTLLEARLATNPNAARYDLEVARIKVARKIAGNRRAVVSMGAGDLVTDLLLAHEAQADAVAAAE